MNKIVYKQSFTIQEAFVLYMPVYSEVIKIAYQDGLPTLWYLHDVADTDGTAVARHFRVVGTGSVLEAYSICQHIETLIDYTNGAVWHIFEVNHENHQL